MPPVKRGQGQQDFKPCTKCCLEEQVGPGTPHYKLLISVPTADFGVIQLPSACLHIVNAKKLEEHQRTPGCGFNLGQAILAVAIKLNKAGELPLEEGHITVRTMAQLRAIGPGFGRALARCTGNTLKQLSAPAVERSATFLKSVFAIAFVVLKLPVPEGASAGLSTCVGYCLKSFLRGFGSRWLIGMDVAMAKAYAEDKRQHLGVSVEQLHLADAKVQMITGLIQVQVAELEERLNGHDGELDAINVRLTALETEHRSAVSNTVNAQIIQGAVRRRSSTGSVSRLSSDSVSTCMASGRMSTEHADLRPQPRSSGTQREPMPHVVDGDSVVELSFQSMDADLDETSTPQSKPRHDPMADLTNIASSSAPPPPAKYHTPPCSATAGVSTAIPVLSDVDKVPLQTLRLLRLPLQGESWPSMAATVRLRTSSLDWGIDFSTLVGKGTFGQVFIAVPGVRGTLDQLPSMIVAASNGLAVAKVIPDASIFQRELHALQQLADLSCTASGHELVTHYIDSYEPATGACLLSPVLFIEYGAFGTLEEAVASATTRPKYVIKLITLQVAEGLTYMHGKNVAHHDLKAANVLLTQPYGRIVEVAQQASQTRLCSSDDMTRARHAAFLATPCFKLCDFSVAVVGAEASNCHSGAGTVGTMAPEVLGAVPYDARRVDTWSLGALVHQLLTGKLPFVSPVAPQANTTDDHNDPEAPFVENLAALAELMPPPARFYQAPQYPHQLAADGHPALPLTRGTNGDIYILSGLLKIQPSLRLLIAAQRMRLSEWDVTLPSPMLVTPSTPATPDYWG